MSSSTAPFGGARPDQSTFRGTWQPMLYRSTPAFNAFQFLPTPPPQQPRRKAPEPEPETEAGAGAAATAAAEPEPQPEPAAEEPPRELLTGPPIPRADVLFTVTDRERNYRACVAKDGTCTNNVGQVIGYINFDTHEAGSADEEFLGCVVEHPFDNVYQVRDAVEDLCGWIDMGTHTVRSPAGNTVADIEINGVVRHANGTYLGEFGTRHGFHQMREIALYLMLLDPGMLSDVSG